MPRIENPHKGEDRSDLLVLEPSESKRAALRATRRRGIKLESFGHFRLTFDEGGSIVTVDDDDRW